MANVFQEGEPLDVTQLNQMYTDLVKLQAQFGAMTSAGNIVTNLLGSTVPVIDLGFISSKSISPGAVAEYPMNSLLAKKFTANTIPTLTVTPFAQLSAKDAISISIGGAGLEKIVYVTNTGASTLRVALSWHAIYLKPI